MGTLSFGMFQILKRSQKTRFYVSSAFSNVSYNQKIIFLVVFKMFFNLFGLDLHGGHQLVPSPRHWTVELVMRCPLGKGCSELCPPLPPTQLRCSVNRTVSS